MFADHPPIESPPRRRWRFWLLLTGVPILAFTVSGAFWVLRMNSALQAAIAEADRLDPRWRLEEIEADRFTPAPGQNGADKIAMIRRLLPGGWPGGAGGASQTYRLFDELPSEHRLNDRQRAGLAEILELAGPARTEARSLIDTPNGRYAVAYTPDWFSSNLAVIQTPRAAAVLLRYDALHASEAGDFDGAIWSCHATINAGCSVGDETGFIAQFVRIANNSIATKMLERTLAQGEPSVAVLVALQAQLEKVEPAPLMLYGMRGERAGGFRFLQGVLDGTIPAGNALATIGAAGTLPPDFTYLLNTPGYVAVQQAEYLRYMTRMVEIAKRPPEEWAEPFAAELTKEKQLPAFARLLTPAFDKVAGVCQSNHATLRCAIVAIAAERYRRQIGQWPATPDDLVKAGLIKSVPNDPYVAGQRIKFARKVDGLAVYSVGENGVDDGGNLTRDWRGIGADDGFRLWDVAARRQPPLQAEAETP